MEVKIRDINLHYEEMGSGRPVLILHGWGLNGRLIMPLLEPAFETHPGWRRLYLDLPGHGSTPLTESIHNHDDLLDILLEFMDTAAPGEHFVIAGVSWGGYLARGIVHQRLKKVDGVLLFVPAITWTSAERERPPRQVIRRDPEFVSALQPGEEWIREEVVAQSRSMLDDLRAVMVDWTPQDPAVVNLLDGIPFSFNPDRLSEPCSAPTLFVMGRQDHSVGYKEAWTVLENYPRATFSVLDSAGHLLGFEQPVVLRALLNNWLDRVEEYIAQNPAP